MCKRYAERTTGRAAGGRRRQDVAQRLGKSLRTVEFQMNMIFRKLVVTRRAELAHVLS